MNVLRQISGTGIMAVGMLFVILTRGIDLSVGSVSALGSVLSAYLVATWSPEASTALVVLAGAGCGLVTGILVAYLRLPAFVMTLAMMTAARGLSLIISNGQPILLGDSGQALHRFRRRLPVRRAAAGTPDVRRLHRRRRGAGLHQIRPHRHGHRLE